MSGWLRRRREPVAVCLLLLLACLLQDPGRITPDTKLDLVVDPVNFLRQALHLWDALASFGHVPNQAFGYLFPIGPFFALGSATGVPMWIVQRLWMGLLLVAAFWGVLRVAEALGIGSDRSRLIGAAVYALSPPMTALVTSASGGQIPMTLAPWVLLPLISGARAGSTRRAAARSGIAVVAMGAVNAVSTIAVLPLPALWLLTRRRGPRRASLVRWWSLSIVLACLWWFVPLLLQGRYGLNFTPYTEKAATTTATTSAFETLRGTAPWLNYLFVGGPWLRGGWMLATDALAIVGTGGLVVIGVFGLARRDMVERVFLCLAFGFGVVVIALAYGGDLGGGLAGPAQHLLDGPLSPFRNLTKFEPVLRVPLALALAHGLTRIKLPPVERAFAATVVIVLVALSALPYLRNQAIPDGAFRAIPAYWRDASRWLDTHGPQNRTLVVPASAFGEYRWGRPLDEPLEPLAGAPWAVRSLVPLGTSELTRLLNGIDSEVSGGAAPAIGLADVLARAGVQHLVVRNDLDLSRTAAPPPAQVRRALDAAPGVRIRASFGPLVSSRLTTERLAPDLDAASAPVRAIDVYEVDRPIAPAVAYPSAGAVVVAGGPEALLQLAARTDLASTPVLLTGDAVEKPLTSSSSVLADGFERRDADFGLVRDNESYALTDDEPAPGTDRPPEDWAAPAGRQSPVRMTGATVLSASSYATSVAREPERQPYAAFDGDPSTAWVTGSPTTAVGQWLEVRFPHPVTADYITVELLRDTPARPRASAITLTTDRGSVTGKVTGAETAQRLTLPTGPTSRLRLTIAAVTGGIGRAGVGIREVNIPGIAIARTVVLPSLTHSSASPVVMLDRLRADPYDATRRDEEASLDRAFQYPTAADPGITATAAPRPGASLNALLTARYPTHLGVTPTSTWGSLPAFGGRNLADNDPSTIWLADPADQHPAIHLFWQGDRTLDRVTLRPAPGPTLLPTRIQIVAGATAYTLDVPDSGEVSFPPIVTDEITVNIVESEPSAAVRSGLGFVTPAAVGLRDLAFPALDDLRGPPPSLADPVTIGCGEGPKLVVNGVPHSSMLSGTVGDLFRIGEMRMQLCDAPPSFTSGEQRIQSTDDDAFAVDSVTIGRLPPPATGRQVNVTKWNAEDRSVTVAPGPGAILATTENFNDGWNARLDGRVLSPVRVDGWRQGWLLPAGAGGGVHLTFQPGIAYRVALIAGMGGVLALVGLALARRRNSTALAPCGAAVMPWWLAFTLASGAAFLCGGWAVLVVVPLLLLVRSWLSFAAAASVVLAIGIAAGQHGATPGSGIGSFGSPVQLLTVFALAAVVFAAGVVARPQSDER